VAHRFPDGQLYLDLRRTDADGAPVSPADALGYFVEALGVPPDRVPASLAGRAGLFRSLTAGRRILVVLDNSTDAGQIRPLLPATPQSLVLVTSRTRLTELIAGDGAYPLTLRAMSTAETLELLLSRRSGSH
jgi:hypothetical protein